MKPIQLEKRTVTNPDGETVTITRSFIPMPKSVDLDDKLAVQQELSKQGVYVTPERDLPDVLDQPLKKQDVFDIQKICDGLRRKSSRNERRAIKKAYNKRLKK